MSLARFDRLVETKRGSFFSGVGWGYLPNVVFKKKRAKLLVLGLKLQMARKGKRTHFTQKQLETLIAKARAAERKTRSKTGKLLASKGGSSTQSAGANEPVLELVAWYGYDPMNRSVYGYVAQSNEPNRYSNDGWQQKDQYKNDGNDGFDLVRVQIDGPGIDEHLGFARNEGSSSQPPWKRYALYLCAGSPRQCDESGQ